jgi:hypothetical protein
MAMGIGYAVIIGLFLFYYLLLIIIERKVIRDPSEIIDKFLSVILMYAGLSLIYYSITGRPFLNDTPETYNIYIFIIGFIALLWTVPNLLEKFTFFKDFTSRKKKKK